MDYSLSVTNHLAGNIDSVKVGDVNLALDDGASLSYDVSVTADKGNITSFQMGNVALGLGVNAIVNSFDVNLAANGGGNIDKVAIGDISITEKSGAAASFTISADATTGKVGELDVGVVSINTVKDSVVNGSITALRECRCSK